MKYFPGFTEAERAKFVEDYALAIRHLRAARGREEAHLRRLALRVCRRSPAPRWDFDDLPSRQRARLENYRDALAWIRHRRKKVEAHRARLLARGVAPADLWRHPYKTPAEKREEREHAIYVRYARREGLPIPLLR